MSALLHLAAVSHSYGELRAVDDLTLEVRSGSRHAIIGPNGAGKTTVVDLVAGAKRPSAGRIIYAGADITKLSTRHRAQRGIIRTWQDPATYDRLTALDNVILGLRDLPSFAAARPPDVVAAAHDALATVGLSHHARTPAGWLPWGERRLVELAIALAAQPRLLLLDEPSAGLGPDGVTNLVDMVSRLPGEVTVLLVDHDLDLVFRVADAVTVMHHGRHLATGASQEIRTNPDVRDAYLATSRSVGRADRPTAPVPAQSPALRVRDLHAGYGAALVLQDVSFDVAGGEIVAVVGHNGAGKTTLLHTVAGLHRPQPPTRIELLGQAITNNRADRIAAAGIALAPQGRRLFATLTVGEHLAVVRRRAGQPPVQATGPDVLALFPALAARLRHRPSQLSGGEQQMLAIARALLTNPHVLLLDEPSEGLAPQLIAHLANVLSELARAGTAILLTEQSLTMPNAIADHVFCLAAQRSDDTVDAGRMRLFRLTDDAAPAASLE